MIFFAANVSIRNCSSCEVLNYSTALASNQCSFANLRNSEWATAVMCFQCVECSWPGAWVCTIILQAHYPGSL
jgi:hypothetical protein